MWQIKAGIIGSAGRRLICLGPESLEFTFNDERQVVDVRRVSSDPLHNRPHSHQRRRKTQMIQMAS
jgi:hypothetical protein